MRPPASFTRTTSIWSSVGTDRTSRGRLPWHRTGTRYSLTLLPECAQRTTFARSTSGTSATVPTRSTITLRHGHTTACPRVAVSQVPLDGSGVIRHASSSEWHAHRWSLPIRMVLGRCQRTTPLYARQTIRVLRHSLTILRVRAIPLEPHL